MWYGVLPITMDIILPGGGPGAPGTGTSTMDTITTGIFIIMGTTEEAIITTIPAILFFITATADLFQ